MSKRFKFSVREIDDDGIRTHKLPLTTGSPADGNVKQAVPAAAPVAHQEVKISTPPAGPTPTSLFIDEQPETAETTSDYSPWTAVHDELLEVNFDIAFAECTACPEKVDWDGHVRCRDCGVQTFYCSENCYSMIHSMHVNAFHKPVQWKVDKYVEFNNNITFIRPDHTCGNLQVRRGIQVYDHLGRVHTVSVETCGCEKDIVTFFRHGLWTSSIEQPNVAFHVELLNTIEFMMLEGKISLHAFCQSMRWRNQLTVHECETLYTRLRGEPMEHYRHLKFLSRNFSFLNTTDDTVDQDCIACPKENGGIYVSLDANFGLVRKKVGNATSHSNHKDAMFLTEPINAPTDAETSDQQCSNFQAGNILRSKTTNKKLAVTGVFGSACRHGTPIAFLDMTAGERLSLSEVMIDHLLNRVNGKDVKMHIIYDIACMLHARLRAKGNAKFEDVSFAVPSFHAYGHKGSCQVQYSTRWQSGYGLTDGEDMERLWAYLRRFCFITKEMTSGHRIDLLTDALFHYRRKKHEEMDFTLARNLEKANTVLSSMSADLQKHISTIHVEMTMDEVDDLVKVERDALCNAAMKDAKLTDEEKYIELLLKHSEIKGYHKSSMGIQQQGVHEEKLTRVKEELTKLEAKIGIERRWKKKGKQFKRHQRSLQKKRKLHLLFKLHQNALELDFMHNLKGKYSVRNQKIAKRLEIQIQRARKAVKRTVCLYNNSGFDNADGISNVIEYSDVIKPESSIYQYLHAAQESVTSVGVCLSASTRLKVAELRNRQLRAEEELALTRREMLAMLENLCNQHAKYSNNLKHIRSTSHGLKIALTEQLEEMKTRYHRARTIFAKYISLPPVPNQLGLKGENVIQKIIEEQTSYLPSSGSDTSDSEEDC